MRLPARSRAKPQFVFEKILGKMIRSFNDSHSHEIGYPARLARSINSSAKRTGFLA